MANIKNFDFDPNNPPECSYSGCANLVERIRGERKWKKYCCKDCGELGGAEQKRLTFNKNFGKQNPEAREELIQKRKDAWIEKYGVDNPQKAESVREKTEQTNIQKYGVTATTMVPEFKQAIRETNIARYGYPTPLQNPEILEKMKATNLEKWGVEWTSLNPEVRRKQEETCLANYGVRNPLQSIQVRCRIQDTLVERYGVDNPTKNVDILEKALTSGKVVRQYNLPSGKTIKLRGYEPIALNIILESYHEDDVTYNIKDMPKINYQHEGKTRRYYPDFFLPSENTILEVKSVYTYDATKEVNYLKRDACVAAGYVYMFIVVSSSAIRVEYTDTTYESVQEAAVREASILTDAERVEVARLIQEVLNQRKAQAVAATAE